MQQTWMPVQQLPEFELALAAAAGALDAGDLSECHGAACGMLCRRPREDAEAFLRLLAALELVHEPGEELREFLVRLHAATASQIGDQQMRFSLWLPGDEEALEDRTRALARWSSGFLAGLAFDHDTALDNLSEDIEGVLGDVQQIALAETTADADADAEEEEQALTEIIEYLRVVTLMLREELRPAAPRDSVH